MSATQTKTTSAKTNGAKIVVDQVNAATLKADAAEAVAKTRTPEQQAALDEMRAARIASEALYAETDLGESINSIFESMPSGKRMLAACLATFTTAGVVGYGIRQLVDYGIAVIATYSTAAAWPIIIMVLGAIISIYISLKIGKHLGNYILSGQIDRDVASAWNWMFGAKKVEAASA